MPILLIIKSNRSYDHWKEECPEEYEKFEKIYFGLEDWVNRKLPWSGWNFKFGEHMVWYEKEKVTRIFVLPEEEYQKIVSKQNEILESHVKANLDWKTSEFSRKLSKSLEPELFINQEIEKLDNVLYDKGYSNFVVWYNQGNSFTSCDYSPESTFGSRYSNKIAYWYERIFVRVDYEARIFMNPSDEGDYSRYIPVVAALYIYRFREYLKEILLKHVKDKTTNTSYENRIKLDPFYRELPKKIDPKRIHVANYLKKILGEEDEETTTAYQDGKRVIFISPAESIDVIDNAIKIGISNPELNIFIDYFNNASFTFFATNKHRIDSKNDVDVKALIDEIFEVAELFKDKRLGELFLTSIYNCIQIRNNNPGWSKSQLKFNRQFEQRLKGKEQRMPGRTPKSKAKPKDPSFIALFKHNEDRLSKFFVLLKHANVRALDENNKWIFNKPEK